MKKEPQPFKKKISALQKQFDNAVKKFNWKEAQAIGRDTLKDLHKPKEMFALAAAVIIPGGGVVYCIHRVRQYRRKQKPGNDNKEPKL